MCYKIKPSKTEKQSSEKEDRTPKVDKVNQALGILRTVQKNTPLSSEKGITIIITPKHTKDNKVQDKRQTPNS